MLYAKFMYPDNGWDSDVENAKKVGLKVGEKYEVEYSLADNFNYEVEEFHDLLSSLDVSYTGDSYDNQFEVSKEEWKRGIDKLKNLPNLETAEEKEDIESALEKLEEPLAEIIEFMELLLEEADENHEFMVLSFH